MPQTVVMRRVSAARNFDIPVDLSTVLHNRRWILADCPFSHVSCTEIFQPDFYQALENSFHTILSLGLSETPAKDKFSRIFRGYDAYGAKLPAANDDPLRIFVSREWHDMLAGLFNVKVTGDVNAELHHHVVGSSTGRIHNDLNPGWFVGEAEPGSVNLSDNEICSYKFGERRSGEQRTPVQRVRAVAMLFYLANPKWRSRHGGETGLYEFEDSAVKTPAVAIPPVNNSLIAFEVTPSSFHAFLKNKRSARNAVVLWLHRTYEDAVAQWGERSISKWSRK
jgi:hypothetical protein